MAAQVRAVLVGWTGIGDVRLHIMFGRKKNRGLYYLLPGMTRANRVKQRKILQISILIGVLFAMLFALVLYWMNKPHINYDW